MVVTIIIATVAGLLSFVAGALYTLIVLARYNTHLHQALNEMMKANNLRGELKLK